MLIKCFNGIRIFILGKFDAAKVLVDHGADVNAIVFFNRYPLHLAAKGGFFNKNFHFSKQQVSKDSNDAFTF